MRFLATLFAVCAMVACGSTVGFQKPAQAFNKRIPKNNMLHVRFQFAENGDTTIAIHPNKRAKREIELARMFAHWFSKVMYIIPDSMSRAVLINEVRIGLFEPPLRPKQDVLKRVDIADVIRLVPRLAPKRIVASIDLYLVPRPNNQRGIVSYLSGQGTNQQTVYSWAVLLQKVAATAKKSELVLISRIMEEVIRAYSAGADPDSGVTMLSIPNNAYIAAMKTPQRLSRVSAKEPKPANIMALRELCKMEAAKACHSLGVFYEAGVGLKKDLASAGHFYELACKQGKAGSCNRLGTMLAAGEGVAKDLKKALTVFDKGCKLDSSKACHNIGTIYAHGRGVKVQGKKALLYYKQACKGGIAEACYNLGSMLGNGDLVRRNLRQAHKWFLKGCNLDNASACYFVGVMYRDGAGAKRNRAKSKSFFKKACDLGFTRACAN
jgi:TPR repeat protein